jgi:hypothetical protein
MRSNINQALNYFLGGTLEVGGLKAALGESANSWHFRKKIQMVFKVGHEMLNVRPANFQLGFCQAMTPIGFSFINSPYAQQQDDIEKQDQR